MNNPIIEVNGLASGYVKGLNILQGVDLVLKDKEIVSIIKGYKVVKGAGVDK